MDHDTKRFLKISLAYTTKQQYNTTDMSIEAQLSDLKAAITENTAALREILAAGGVPANVVPIATESPKKPATKQAKTKETPAPEPTPEPAPEPETDRPTKVAVSTPAEDEFSDPLDPETTVVPGTGSPEPEKIDVDAVIKDCIEIFKGKMTAADPAAKAKLKDVTFPALREKYGLKPDDKLVVLTPTPEKLVALLADIKAL